MDLPMLMPRNNSLWNIIWKIISFYQFSFYADNYRYNKGQYDIQTSKKPSLFLIYYKWKTSWSYPPSSSRFPYRKWAWQWISHAWTKPKTSTPREALDWNSHGNREHGGPIHSWKRTRLKELEKIGKTLGEAKRTATNKSR